MSLKKLNLGCGNDIRVGWTNVDVAKLPGVDIVYDVERVPLPFKNEVFDIVLCNDHYDTSPSPNVEWVEADQKSLRDSRLYTADFVDPEHPWRHDANKLSQTLMYLFYERTGPLGE